MADLSSKCFSSYARIFCPILNNLARVIYVINANGTLCISLVPSIWRWARWFLSKARCLSSANEWILDLFSSFIAELTILLHLGLCASPIELKLLCREKFTRAFKSIYAGVFSPLYYPWGKRGLTHSWKRNPLSKRVFCAQWNTRKAWWERIYRILGQFQVRFFIQIQIVISETNFVFGFATIHKWSLNLRKIHSEWTRESNLNADCYDSDSCVSLGMDVFLRYTWEAVLMWENRDQEPNLSSKKHIFRL